MSGGGEEPRPLWLPPDGTTSKVGIKTDVEAEQCAPHVFVQRFPIL
jgi:hypothetical protein